MSVPRWSITVEPAPNNEAHAQLVANEPDVAQGEIVLALLRVATQLAGAPNARILTADEINTLRERQVVMRAHPVEVAFLKLGAEGPIFLSKAGEEAVGAELAARGWAPTTATGLNVVCAWACPGSAEGQILQAELARAPAP